MKERMCCYRASHTFQLPPIQQRVFCWHGTVQNICSLLNVTPPVILNSSPALIKQIKGVFHVDAQVELKPRYLHCGDERGFLTPAPPARTCWCVHNHIRRAARLTGIAKLKFHCSCNVLSCLDQFFFAPTGALSITMCAVYNAKSTCWFCQSLILSIFAKIVNLSNTCLSSQLSKPCYLLSILSTCVNLANYWYKDSWRKRSEYSKMNSRLTLGKRCFA